LRDNQREGELRDLMFIGGGVAGVRNGARVTEPFYTGYGTCEEDSNLAR
jgi:hypothetical protein